MRFQVTRQQVIKAIKNEPLKAGSWIHYEDEMTTNEHGDSVVIPNPKFKNNTGCAVCAVGSILDCSLGKKMSAEELGRVGGSLVQNATIETLTERMVYEENDENQKFISNGEDVSVRELVRVAAKAVKQRPLSALSSLFEALMDREEMVTNGKMANYRARRILIKFVKNHFPTKLKLDTNRQY